MTTPKPRSLPFHFAMLAAGFVAILLSSHVLSKAATSLVDQHGISADLFGVVILSIATTTPEKFISALSGYKGHMGIMMAHTVGSNIFLLTLCIGIIW
jgi:Ca2+/Na+ antiporter